MKIFKVKYKPTLQAEEIQINDWHFVTEVGIYNPSFVDSWDVIIPENAAFISDSGKEFIDKLGENIVVDCVSSDYPLCFDSYKKIFETFTNKNIKVLSPNLLLYGEDNHYFIDPKMKQMEFIFKNSILFDELAKIQSKFLRNKKYLFLTNHIRFERVEMLSHLYHCNNIEDGLVGFPSIEKVSDEELHMVNHIGEHREKIRLVEDIDFGLPYNLDFFRPDNYETNKKHRLWNGTEWFNSSLHTGDFNLVLYLNAYFEMFSETYFYGFGSVDTFIENKNIPQYIQVSEKTLKPIINLLPFLCLTDAGYYKKLKQMGLKFESKFYQDLSWDGLRSGSEKMLTFNEYIAFILSHSKNTLHEWYYTSLDEIIHNKHVFIRKMNNEIKRFLK